MSFSIQWNANLAKQLIRHQELHNPLMLVSWLQPEAPYSHDISQHFSLIHCFEFTGSSLNNLAFTIDTLVPKQYIVNIPSTYIQDKDTSFLSPLASDNSANDSLYFKDLITVLTHATYDYFNEASIKNHADASCIQSQNRSPTPCKECVTRLHAQLTLIKIIEENILPSSNLDEEEQNKLTTTAQLVQYCIMNRPPYKACSGSSTPVGNCTSGSSTPSSGSHTPSFNDGNSGSFRPIQV